MSGAAGIAAAKNRRSKTELNTTRAPVVNCKTVGSCPAPQSTSVRGQPQAQAKTGLIQAPAALVDQDSLQIKGPMTPVQILMVHEQRLNKFDDKLNQFGGMSCPQPSACSEAVCDPECYDKINELELKIHMLEEVIMNLQLTITNVQSFAMETSLAMLKLQNSYSQSPSATPSATPAAALSRPTTPLPLFENDLASIQTLSIN